MNKLISFAFFLFVNTLFSQTNIDAFLGNNGIFKTLSAKNIAQKDAILFDLKLSVKSTAIGGSNKVNTLIIYLNTKDGYIGIDKSVDNKNIPNENTENLDFLIETMTNQSIRFTTNGTNKTQEKLETNLINTFNNRPIKQVDANVAKSKKYLNNSVIAFPYFVDVMGLQKKYIRFCYGKNLPVSGLLKSYLGSYGVGFYNIDDITFLCVATEYKFMNMEITKIEKVNFLFDTTSFKIKI
jgi:hypothetical protein